MQHVNLLLAGGKKRMWKTKARVLATRLFHGFVVLCSVVLSRLSGELEAQWLPAAVASLHRAVGSLRQPTSWEQNPAIDELMNA